jgi:hypothetical protein
LVQDQDTSRGSRQNREVTVKSVSRTEFSPKNARLQKPTIRNETVICTGSRFETVAKTIKKVGDLKQNQDCPSGCN